ncbi:MAG: hypothetical protein HQK51_12260 [Oligoflexia bacterium]|nr:hypothetical protein [Oligoflexia bacterium]
MNSVIVCEYFVDFIRSKRVFSQKVEAAIGCKILNIMSKLGMPETIRI